jgi:hypothetical protein
MAWHAWKTIREAQRYVEEANRIRLSQSAGAKMRTASVNPTVNPDGKCRWEMPMKWALLKPYGKLCRRATTLIRQWLAVTNIPKPAHRFAGASKPSD